jgi:hypothetical protein
MRHILRMRSDAAQDTEHALDEEGWLDQPSLDEMCAGIEMADVITLDLEARAIIGTARQDRLNVFEGVAEDAPARTF